MPYELGTERGKGSHSMAGYHSFELAYLSAVYFNLLMNNKPMDFFFSPTAGTLPNDTLRVSPDLLPEGSVHIGQVWINGQPCTNFDAEKMTVKLPATGGRLKVRVRLVPQNVAFTADLLEIQSGAATISLAGNLTANSIQELRQEVDMAIHRGAKSIVFDVEDLTAVDEEGLRVFAFTKQKLGANFPITIAGATASVKDAFSSSGILEECAMAELAV
jgi:anti-anti-sigma factor